MIKLINQRRWVSKIHQHLITQQKFKDTMSQMATQVTLISIANPIGSPKSEYRGLIASSVTSLCVAPIPKLQFNLQLPSFTSDALHKHKHFAVHLMKPTLMSADLGRLFSKGAIVAEDGSLQPSQPFVELEEHKIYETYQIDGTNLQIPILKVAEKTLICKFKDVFRTDDHEIWVATIEDILLNDKENHTGGLLYYNRHFYGLGDKIK